MIKRFFNEIKKGNGIKIYKKGLFELIQPNLIYKHTLGESCIICVNALCRDIVDGEPTKFNSQHTKCNKINKWKQYRND